MNVDLCNTFGVIDFVDDDFDEIADAIKSLDQDYSSLALISDEHVYRLFGEKVLSSLSRLGIPLCSFSFPCGETSKTLHTVEECCAKVAQCGLDRKALIISLGGGVTTDLAGFVASCYMRGVDVIHIPTTLLAMVDAAIGGKTGVNLPEGKNLVGAFHQPRKVLLLPQVLKTLPDGEFRSGLAEVIKSAVIDDDAFFSFLEREMGRILDRDSEVLRTVLEKSCAIKTKIVSEDEFETGIRALLNYGHTFGHAIETATQYRRYRHGEAVSIGMSCAAYVARELGYVDEALIDRQDTLCRKAGLPITLPSDLTTEQLLPLMRRDKKAVSGKINLIVPEKVGKVIRVLDVDEGSIRKALEEKRLRDQE